MTATIEDVRAYWNRRPCNIKHSKAASGTKQYYDEIEARKYMVEPHIPTFADFHRWRGKKVLELGCGIGTDTINFARAGARVTAVDLSDESLAICADRVKLYGLQDSVGLIQANGEELTKYITVEPYDLIYSFGVIHHTPNPPRVMEELKAFSNADTELRLMLYAKYSVKSLQMLVGKVTCEAQPDVPVAYTYTKHSIRKLLAPNFRLISAHKDHIFPWKISDYINYQYNKVWIWRMMPHLMFRALERMFGWHWLIKAEMR